MLPPDAVPSAGPAVLLVDDRPENLLALDALLAPLARELGARLLQAGGADGALRHVLAEGDALAVVLLDVQMPGTDGIETARLIRRRARSGHLPVIFVTAHDADPHAVAEGYAAGAVDYLFKPLAPDAVLAKVRTFVELYQHREAARAAARAAGAAEAARREEAALVDTVQRVGAALASELDVERIVQAVTDEATALTGAQFGAFFYTAHDPRGGGEMTLYTLSGVAHSHFSHFPHPRATPVFGPTFRGEGVVRSADITAESHYGRMAPHHGMPAGHLPVKSYLAVPVRSRTGAVLGGLFFGHERAGVFTEREERLVVGVAGWAAVAMDNARLYAAEQRARAALSEQARELEFSNQQLQEQAAELEQQAELLRETAAELEERSEQAQTARAAAEAANRAKSEFLAVMSHELRTPLTAIGGYADLIAMGIRGAVTAEQRDDLARLKRAQQHLLGVITDVLEVANLEAGRATYRIQPVRLAPLLDGLGALIGPQAAARGVSYAYAPCGDGLVGRADPGKLRQVVLNLLSNAVKFTPAGGTVRLSCGDGPSVVTVAVHDTGIGIPADKREAVFAPFVQLDQALTRTAEGAGLGLAISRDLARGMGGDLTLQSEVGTGSTFTLTLPRA
jgi:signal transduction histidine kinase/CheY-like chemotaxis protein